MKFREGEKEKHLIKNLGDCVGDDNSFKGAVVQPVQCFPAEIRKDLKIIQDH